MSLIRDFTLVHFVYCVAILHRHCHKHIVQLASSAFWGWLSSMFWWKFIIMMLSNINIFALLTLCAWNSLFTNEFPSLRPVTRSFNVFFDLRLKNNGWANNRSTGDLRHHNAHYDVTAMVILGLRYIRMWWSFVGNNMERLCGNGCRGIIKGHAIST